MKTLDEVINKLECYPVSPSTLPYSVSIVTVEDLNDALHYLKELRQNLAELGNPPLTWDKLRTMGGKPVWVEPCKEWMLITEIETEPHIWLLSLDGMDYDMSLHEWQAYRKER